MPKKCNVYVTLYASTLRQACKEAWIGKFAYFAWAGHVYFCLGNGSSDDDWFESGPDTKDLS